MAKASAEVIQVLRKTAKTIAASAQYQWGHMGACNCGFLAQEITQLNQAEIHRRALMRHGDWSEQLNDYCPMNGLPFDDIISGLIEFGFDSDDLKHLEKLSDPKIIRSLSDAERTLTHNNKNDVILYIRAWANLLEEELVKDIHIPASMMNSSLQIALK
jgi:hypothetical protein